MFRFNCVFLNCFYVYYTDLNDDVISQYLRMNGFEDMPQLEQRPLDGKRLYNR